MSFCASGPADKPDLKHSCCVITGFWSFPLRLFRDKERQDTGRVAVDLDVAEQTRSAL